MDDRLRANTGSPEAHVRATLARMRPLMRLALLRRLLTQEIAAQQRAAHEENVS